MSASRVDNRVKICFLALLLIVLCAPVGALVNASDGLRVDGANRPALIGNWFVVTTDAAGEATRICAAGFKVLSCFDARTWKRLWSEKTPYGSVDTDLHMSGDILLYAGGGGAWTIYGTSSDNGKILWTKNDQSFVLATGRGMVFAAHPYTPGIIALSARSGKRKWTTMRVSPDVMFFYEGKLFTDSGILDAETGKLVKRLHFDSRTFAASGGRVFGADKHGRLRAWNAVSGALIWSRTLHSAKAKYGNELAANSKEVFAVFLSNISGLAHHGVLKAFNASDGRVMWGHKITSDYHGIGGSPIGADSAHVYLIGPSHKAHGSKIIALDARTGKPIWTRSLAKRASGPPVVTKKVLYVDVGDVEGGDLVEIEERDGKVVKSVPIPY